mmetsp:Transcript_12883/g.43578  ORF Transcript_12883/g.43578 Transcript_12883/m.43578 type:complete len:209 (-) Transcript_12883:247-873(-)
MVLGEWMPGTFRASASSMRPSPKTNANCSCTANSPAMVPSSSLSSGCRGGCGVGDAEGGGVGLETPAPDLWAPSSGAAGSSSSAGLGPSAAVSSVAEPLSARAPSLMSVARARKKKPQHATATATRVSPAPREATLPPIMSGSRVPIMTTTAMVRLVPMATPMTLMDRPKSTSPMPQSREKKHTRNTSTAEVAATEREKASGVSVPME